MSLKCAGCNRGLPKGKFGCVAICESKFRHVTPIHKTCKTADILKCTTCNAKIIYTMNQETMDIPILTASQEKKACKIFKQINSRADNRIKKDESLSKFINNVIGLNLATFEYTTYYEQGVLVVRKNKQKEFANLKEQYGIHKCFKGE
jgi:hypothetical protein